MPHPSLSKTKSHLARAISAYGDDHHSLLVDLHSLLVVTIGYPFILSTNAVSLKTEDVLRHPSPLLLSPPLCEQHPSEPPDTTAANPTEPSYQTDLVDEQLVALTHRDLIHRTFPPVHNASFSFEPQIILSFIHNNVQRVIVTSGIDLYIQYAKAQRGLLPLVKISLFVLGAEAWKAYSNPVTKSTIINAVSKRFEQTNRKTQLTTSSNLLKRSIRFFQVITSVGTDYLFDKCLAINQVISLKKTNVDDFIATFTRPAFGYLDILTSKIGSRTPYYRLLKHAQTMSADLVSQQRASMRADHVQEQ